MNQSARIAWNETGDSVASQSHPRLVIWLCREFLRAVDGVA